MTSEKTEGTYEVTFSSEAATFTVNPDLYEHILWVKECPDCLRQDGKHNSRCPKGNDVK